MKWNKYGILLLASLAISVSSKAQQEKLSTRVIIEPYIGYITGDLENRIFSDRATPISAPISFGNRVEFKLTKALSLGLDANYANVKIGWNDTYSTLSGSYYEAALTQVTERREKSVEKIRLMLRFKAYFIQNEKWAGYAVWAVGSKFVRETDLITDLPIEHSRVPFTQRIGIGFGHYFTSNIGCSMEFGLGGGSPIQLGLSLRL